MRRGAWAMVAATLVFTALSLAFLWVRAGAIGVAGWDFLIMAVIVTLVWFAIGAVMTFYIVMIIKKNENRDR